MPHLDFRQGDLELFTHLLHPGRTVLGRADSCDLALPSDQVSRVHAIVERRTEGWRLFDRSRHGTRVNGEPVSERLLADGDLIAIGPYTARFVMRSDKVADPTAYHPMAFPTHEEVVEVADGGVALTRAELEFVRGPRAGQTELLRQARVTVGGPGATVQLAEDLPSHSARIRVVRGRVMVEPGDLAVFLAGERVRELTPALIGEEVRIGPHGFVVKVRTTAESLALPEEGLGRFGAMVGETPRMRRLFAVLTRMAASDAPVLLTGESGTGKELAARGLHDVGTRSDGPFVALNCAGIPQTLFESELFGYEKGAFSGASARTDGAWQRAAGGTLFLDEIGELHPEAQAKLLRALESGEVRRVGGGHPEYPDVRVVAATNRDLGQLVGVGKFRKDLYFRLTVLGVELPALRDRMADLPLLATTLLGRQHPGASLAPDAVARLGNHDWPGNVRELRNVLTRAVVMTGPEITASELSFDPLSFQRDASPEPPAPDISRDAIVEALHVAMGNRTRAARDLGIPRSSLLYKMKRLGIS